MARRTRDTAWFERYWIVAAALLRGERFNEKPREAGLFVLLATWIPDDSGMTSLSGYHMSMSPMPPMPPPGIAGAFSSFGSSATIASVVRMSAATEAAFWSA